MYDICAPPCSQRWATRSKYWRTLNNKSANGPRKVWSNVLRNWVPKGMWGRRKQTLWKHDWHLQIFLWLHSELPCTGHFANSYSTVPQGLIYWWTEFPPIPAIFFWLLIHNYQLFTSKSRRNGHIPKTGAPISLTSPFPLSFLPSFLSSLSSLFKFFFFSL